MYGNFKAYPYDSRLCVSDQGWVKNLKSGVVTRGHVNKKGYYVFSLTKCKVKRVHDMVLETFVGPCPEGFECGHKNANGLDNRLVNLEWVSRSDNNRNPITLKRRWMSKGGYIWLYCVGNRIVKITETRVEMGKYLGIPSSTVNSRIRIKYVDDKGGRLLRVKTIQNNT